MRRILTMSLLSVLLSAANTAVHAQDQVRYVTDELAIALRDGPSADSPARGVLMSGARVVMLESRAGTGYARVRTDDGREAWIQEKYLKADPIARARADRAEKELAAAQAELKKLKEDNARLLQDFGRISGGEPVASSELVAENEKLRAQVRDDEQQMVELRARARSAGGEQRTLLLGGALVLAGGLLALLLRWLWPRRRWGDL